VREGVIRAHGEPKQVDGFRYANHSRHWDKDFICYLIPSFLLCLDVDESCSSVYIRVIDVSKCGILMD